MTASPSPRPQQPSTTQPTDQQTAPKDSPKQLFGVYIKGMAMGAADIVPGVSGGTIALIAGIYEQIAIGAMHNQSDFAKIVGREHMSWTEYFKNQ